MRDNFDLYDINILGYLTKTILKNIGVLKNLISLIKHSMYDFDNILFINQKQCPKKKKTFFKKYWNHIEAVWYITLYR